jgi:hypothetical protein
LGEAFLKLSNSAELTLKIIASRVEQRAEIPMVKDIATINSGSEYQEFTLYVSGDGFFARLGDWYRNS